jgi:amino acid adenylation domain-containing protein
VNYDQSTSLQLPCDRLRPAAAAPVAACASFRLPASAWSAAELATALLVQLQRYGNPSPALRLLATGHDACVGGFDSSALSGSGCIAKATEQIAQGGTIPVTQPNVTLCVADHDDGFDAACATGLRCLNQETESLRFIVQPAAGRGALVYDSACIEADTAARLAAHWVTLLGALAGQPDAVTSTLPMMPADEAAFIAAACRGPHLAAAFPDFLDLFARAATDHPDRIAVVYRDRRISYTELDALSRRVALRLRAAGVGTGDRVVVCLDPGAYGAACILGILRLRGAYVPVDPAYPSERIATIVKDAEARLIITTSVHESKLAPLAARLLDIDEVVSAAIEGIGTDTEAPALATDDAYVFYTSGTTGVPKGVLASRANLAQYVGSAIRRYGMRADDVMPCLARATFSISLFEMLAPLACGATSVVLDRDRVLDPGSLAASLTGGTLFHAGPSLLKGLLAHIRGAGAPGYRFPRLRHASSGGDLIPPEVLEQMRAVFAPAEIFVIYGCSEISVMGCTWEVPPAGGITRTYVGRPFEGMEIRVLDAQGQQLPIGVAGEVHFAGPGVITGYLKRPELTSERFRIIDGRRFYNTGDIGRLSSEGLLQLLGRLDFQIQLRGMRVELGEVEHALRQHVHVRDGVVAAHAAADGELQLVAYYVPGAPVLASELRAWFVARVPDYMVPSLYCPLDKLPLNANLKVDRRALPDPSTVLQRPAASNPSTRTPTESRLAGIWHAVLGVTDAGPDDDFFLLGGSSLGVMQVITGIAAEFGVRLAASEIFENGTLRCLAQHIDTRGTGDQAAAMRIPRLAEVDRGRWHELSAAQNRMWFWGEMAPGIALYNVPVLLSIEGALDVSRLQQALDALMVRHEVLRGTWRMMDGRPMQQIRASAQWPLRVEQTRAGSQQAVRADMLTLVESEALQPIDPMQTLPVRALLVRTGAASHALLLTLHHSVCDGWSTELLLRDLFALYANPRSAELRPLAIQYLDYAAWEAGWLASGVRSADLAYWTGKLAGVPGSIDLPADRPRPAAQRYRGALLDVFFSTEEVAALRALARRTGSTLFMVLLAVWQTLLFRLSRQSVIVTGSVIANRGRSEIDDLVGYFANSVALRADFTPDLTVAGLLTQLRRTALEAYDHQATPFEEVVEALKLPRDPARTPLIQTFLELQPPVEALATINGLRTERQMLGTPVAKFDLSLELQECGTGLRGQFEYDSDLFDASTVSRWKDYLHVLMRAMCANEHQAVATLPILPESERLANLVTWNATAAPYDNSVPVFRRFERQAALQPSSVAVVFEGRQLTYAELNASSNRLAQHLRSLGAGKDAPIGVYMERCLELVVAIVAIHKAGAVYVPLDPDLPRERLEYMTRDCAFPMVLTQSSLQERLLGLMPKQVTVLAVDQCMTSLSNLPADNPTATCSADDLAYIIYTSGSTGQPKGVEIPHRGLTNHINWMEEVMAFSRRDRFLQKTTISFDAAVADFWLPLQAGAVIVLARPGGHKDLSYLIELMQQERITVTQFVPSALRVAVDEPDLSRCTSLRFLCVGGETLDWDTARTLYRLLPEVVLGNFYGPSEASDDSTYFPVPRGALDFGIVPIGRPIANVQCYVLDDAGQLAPIGVAGELHVAGAGLARGYRNRAELTAERFVTRSLLPGVRLYRTGDTVRRNTEGLIEFLGRADHQIKLRGFRIELDEIEAAIRSIAKPRQCAVVARKSPSGEPMIVGYLVDCEMNDESLRPALHARLPEYMLPVAFVAMEELPVLPNGKLDRQALPEPRQSATMRQLVNPRSETEEMVCSAFIDALKRDAISVTDNFFDLGGHSLMAGRIMSRLRTQTGLALPLRTLFEHPTIAELASAIDASRWSEQQSRESPSQTDGTSREEFEL